MIELIARIEIIQILIGGFIGFVLTKFLEPIWDKFVNKIKGIFKRNLLKKTGAFLSREFNVASLEHADPVYDLYDIEVNEIKKELFLDFPDDLKEEITAFDKEFEFRKDKSFNRTSNFDELIEITEIEDLKKLIEKHRRIVANKFIEKLKNGLMVFNGKKYGIYNLYRRRVGKEENSSLKIDLYTTDYFTHKVFGSIYRELKSDNHIISSVVRIEELNKYKPFMTSLGVNTYLIITEEDKEKVVFAKRSKYIDDKVTDGRWHVTMNEGLSITDLVEKEVSLVKCLHRGLREELGIKEEHHKYIIDEKFMDLFLEKDEFEVGLTSYVKLDMSFPDLIKLNNIAKDGALETDGLTVVPVKKSALEKFFKNNNFTPVGLYALDMYTSRKKYFAIRK